VKDGVGADDKGFSVLPGGYRNLKKAFMFSVIGQKTKTIKTERSNIWWS